MINTIHPFIYYAQAISYPHIIVLSMIISLYPLKHFLGLSWEKCFFIFILFSVATWIISPLFIISFYEGYIADNVGRYSKIIAFIITIFVTTLMQFLSLLLTRKKLNYLFCLLLLLIYNLVIYSMVIIDYKIHPIHFC